ncbi:diacylglycerol kinase catalytic region [Roseibium sp. TrichSKD4]|uniref:diacylglycerol/lipid kinase family protein n=1 Tax=Roseibium sp. TrichSKD4 TaxID=744980 RepID=UPI0001E56205|nr:YegS/Rv2252/BmrU family lipid kinase [Roseibium sp. TrichSKD4]EFO34466.1 diacylglycerol kinase catalytic region [Roseibium sp. TrichSKD4]
MLKPDKLLIVANPTAGGYDRTVLEAVRAGLEKAGYHVTLHLTSQAGEMGEICSAPTFDAGTLVIAGGDGSVNNALAGLQAQLNTPKLAIIPCGTANVLAHELKLPKKPHKIIEMLTAGQTIPLHAGLANGHPFVLMASSGFDAEVVHAIPLALKRRLGKLAYVVTALKLAFTRKPVDLEAEVDGEIYRGKLIVATNSRFYGGPFCVAPNESVSRAGLHLLVLENDDVLSVIRFALALISNRMHKTKGVRVIPFERARLHSTQAAAVQIDCSGSDRRRPFWRDAC